MTLTQRLTRAGATFIVFGLVAALVPTNENAMATTGNCTTTGSYRLTTDPTGVADQDNSTSSYNFYAFGNPSATGGTYGAVTASYSLSGGGTGTLSPASGTSTRVTRIATGGLNLTALFPDGTSLVASVN